MMMSVGKIQKDPVLGPMIKNHPKVFDPEFVDVEHLILVLGLIYEMTKGQDSYWYPWLRQMPIFSENGENSVFWTENHKNML